MVKLGVILLVKLNGVEEWLTLHSRFRHYVGEIQITEIWKIEKIEKNKLYTRWSTQTACCN